MTTIAHDAAEHELRVLLAGVLVEEARTIRPPDPTEEPIAQRQAHRVALIIGAHAEAVLDAHYREEQRPFEPSTFATMPVDEPTSPPPAPKPSVSVVIGALRTAAEELDRVPEALRFRSLFGPVALGDLLRREADHIEGFVGVLDEVRP